MKIENVSTITPAKLDQSIQNEAEIKTNANDEEIVYEESSQRYFDRKIIQQFNIWMKNSKQALNKQQGYFIDLDIKIVYQDIQNFWNLEF